MKIKLSNSINFEGTDYTELDLDFESLTGRDLINAEVEARMIAGPSPLSELSKPYNAVIAAKAAKVPVELVIDLKAKDFTVVTMEAQNFLLG